jgi:DNA-binding SARP family transcriptional activator
LPASVRDTLIGILQQDGGTFLDSFSSEWVLIERERLFNLQIRGLTLLMQDLAESGRVEEALDHGNRILRMDPMRECVQRQVMWLHVLSGHQANAIRQYQECARILKKELGIAPMAETRALYAFIVSGNRVTPDQPCIERMPRYSIHRDAGLDEELDRLRGFMNRLNSHRRSVFVALSGNQVS